MHTTVGSLEQANYFITKWKELGYQYFEIQFLKNNIIVKTT